MVQERSVRVERRLSAILAADVVGYSRLMHRDEEATHAKLTGLITNTIQPAVAEHGGRVVKNTGDGFLVEFPSSVDAVRAAVQFQTRVKKLTNGDVEDRRISFRVGINIGDVIVEPHDIFGDGVNIAARLQEIAEPGGICISSSVFEHVQGKVQAEFVDIGEQNLKNIDRPVRAFATVRNETSSDTLIRRKQDAFSPPRLSIVVLPFANIGGNTEQDYFVDGVTENLTTDLSRIRGSFVIGRHTAFTYKNSLVNLKQVGRELNVQYVLEGSVQRSNDRMRVNVQLVDAATGNHLWAERFDKPIAELFNMQDEIVSKLANQLETQLTEAEARRSERSPHPNSMELYFQGKAVMYRGWTSETLTQARAIFERSLSLDIKNIDAMVWIAVVDVIVSASYMNDHKPKHVASAEAMAIGALSLAPNHAFAHLVLGATLIASNRMVQGIAECERALALDRNMAEAHAQIGTAKYTLGREAETEDHINEAFRLSPRDVFAHRWLLMIGFAKLHLNANAEAIYWLRRSIEANRNQPIAHFALAATLALVGSLDEAKAAAKAGLACNPGFTIRRFRDRSPSDHPSFVAKRERIYEGMRLAEVPER